MPDAALDAAAEALRALRRMSRALLLQEAERAVDRHWVRLALQRGDRIVYLGRFDTAPDAHGVRHPRALIEVRRAPGASGGRAIVGLFWRGRGQGWGCIVAEGQAARIPRELYRGDPDGEPGLENGDAPWLMPGASDGAIERGVRGLRSDP